MTSGEHETVHLDEVVDLDQLSAASADLPSRARRPRKQCAYCFENKSSILRRRLSGCEDRALERLRRAHPDEYNDYLQQEGNAAKEATEEAWEQHLAGHCKKGAIHA